MGGRSLPVDGLPYLCFHTSTQTLHVSRLPGDQRTRSHPPKPRRFLRSASRHSTLIYIAWPAKKRGGLKERRPIPMPSYLDANAACQSTARGSENTLPTLPKPRRFLRSASRHSTLIYIAWPIKVLWRLAERRNLRGFGGWERVL